MMDKEIRITISGSTATGKTTLVYMLNKFLKENGFDVDITQSDNMDMPLALSDSLMTPSSKIGFAFGNKTLNHINRRINVIKDKTKIKIQEIQTYKPILKPIDHSDIDPYGEENWESEVITVGRKQKASFIEKDMDMNDLFDLNF